jgi:hypothetical protein
VKERVSGIEDKVKEPCHSGSYKRKCHHDYTFQNLSDSIKTWNINFGDEKGTVIQSKGKENVLMNS